MNNRIFADDWRDCLREQYKTVIQQQDARTEATLTTVLYDLGFTEDELAALRFEATLRADDMPDDYVPEEVTRQYYEGVEPAAEAPAVEMEGMMEVIEEIEEDDEPELPAELPLESDITDDELLDSTEADDDPDQPQQLTMF